MSLSFAGFHLEIAFDPTLHIAVLRLSGTWRPKFPLTPPLILNVRIGTSVFTVLHAFIASPVVLVKQRIHLLLSNSAPVFRPNLSQSDLLKAAASAASPICS